MTDNYKTYIELIPTDYDVIYIEICEAYGSLPNPFFETSFRYMISKSILVPENNKCDITNNEISKELKKAYALSD